MQELKTAFLCMVEIEAEARMLGQTPLGQRAVGDIRGGRVSGPRLSGRVLPSGADWLLIDALGCGRLDVRATFELNDGALVYTTYTGRLNIPPDLIGAVLNPETAESVDPAGYYFRSAPTFETASEQYAWLNRIQTVGVGRVTRLGVEYTVYEVL